MIPISTAARAAISAGAVVFSKFDVYHGASPVASNVAVTDGAMLSVDGTASILRSLDLNLADVAALTPLSATSTISPFGNEIRAYSGLYLPVGTPITIPANQTLQASGKVLESWPVGVFTIVDPKLTDSTSGFSLIVKLFDRAYAISLRRLSSAYTIAAGTPLVIAPASSGARPTGAIADLIDMAYPGLTYSFVPTGAATPALVFSEGDDPWQRAQELAASAGLRLYFDAAGVCTLAAYPDPNALVPVFTYSEGDLLEGVEQTVSATGASSHAVVIGEPLDGTPPVRADVYDTDPASPTYWLGPFGDQPTFLRSPMIRTLAQATDAANALLLRSKGALQTVTMQAVPCTAHDAYDAVYLNRTGPTNLSNVPFIMDKFKVPLGPIGSISASFRGRRL